MSGDGEVNQEAMREPGRQARLVSAGDSVAFAQHLAELTRAGLPLADGFRALSSEIPSRRLQRTLLDTAHELELGQPLSESLRRSTARLPDYLQGVIQAGLRANALPELLAQFVRYRTIGIELRRRFWLSLLYPLVLMAVVGALIVFVMVSIVLAFENIFKDFGISIPFITLFIFQVTHFVLDYGLTIIGDGLLVLVVMAIALRIFATPADRRELLMKIPVAGNVLKYSSLSEFCHLLGTLVGVEVPLPEALGLASKGVNDASLARAGARMESEIERGRSLREALDQWNNCPAGLAEMLAWAEQHRNLADSLHLAGDMYEARARSQAGFASVLFGSLTLIFVVFGFGMTVVCLFLPMFTLISRLSG